jgi:hypothetical protein
MATFTKNKQTGAYDVIGSPDEIRAGGWCEVSKKSGGVERVPISRVSKPFTAKFGPNEGQTVVIGTIAPHCKSCGVVQTTNGRGYPNVKIYRNGECADCYEERKMGY